VNPVPDGQGLVSDGKSDRESYPHPICMQIGQKIGCENVHVDCVIHPLLLEARAFKISNFPLFSLLFLKIGLPVVPPRGTETTRLWSVSLVLQLVGRGGAVDEIKWRRRRELEEKCCINNY
jgi:hypothetical protein